MEAEAAAALTPAGGPGTRRAMCLVTRTEHPPGAQDAPPDATPWAGRPGRARCSAAQEPVSWADPCPLRTHAEKL